MLWTGINHTLETITAAIGALKAGSTIVVSEFENWEDIQKTLSDSKADLLLLSPYSQTDKQTSYIDSVIKSIPEMNKGKYY
jgi:hypothetical protein